MSVSAPFLMPSAQGGAGAMQMPAWHVPSMQSELTRHDFPSAHGAQVGAAAVDVGLGTVLDAVGAARRGAGAADATAQSPLAQSEPTLHCLPVRARRAGGAATIDVGLGAVLGRYAVGTARRAAGGADAGRAVAAGAIAGHDARLAGRARGAHGAAAVDVGLGAPFFTPSLQLDVLPVTQTPAVQSSLAQSEATSHLLPSTHEGQVGPPQSTSVSAPFFTPSLQDSGAAVPLLADDATAPPVPRWSRLRGSGQGCRQ